MPATMSILGWKAVGLRCPDHEINCCDPKGNPLPITLIQMPNGTGKTTTLSLLRATLSGSHESGVWGKTQVMEYRKRDDSRINGTFELRLLLNEKRVTIVMVFDFENQRVDYKTTRAHGQVEEFDPPIEFRRFLNEDFVKFYVFDGELADNILNREHTDAQKAVESLFQTHLLKKMDSKISTYWNERTSGVNAKTRQGYNRRSNQLEKWRIRLKFLKKLKREWEIELEEIREKLSRQCDRYESEIKKDEDLRKRVKDADAIAKDRSNQVRESAQGVLDGIRDPHAISPVFATGMYELKQGLDRVKLPASAAREFFDELVEEELCVCGRLIDDEIKEAIQKRAQQYLGSEDVALLNNMKGAIDDAVTQSPHTASGVLSKNIESLTALVRKKRTADNELLELILEAEQSNPDVGNAKKKIDDLQENERELKKQLDILNRKDDTVKLDRIGGVDPSKLVSIETLQEGISKLDDQLTETEDVLRLRLKRDILNNIFGQAHKKARKLITGEIKKDANKRIVELMPDNPIRIEKIDGFITLKGQSSGSAGENLSIGYAFLATLFNRSEEHQLPFVVDSPANPIDLGIRPKIGQLAPVLTHQFIAFLISSEREGFLPSLRKASNREIKYITLFRKGASDYEEKAEKCVGCIRTADGYQVVDKEFFNDFQFDTEEE